MLAFVSETALLALPMFFATCLTLLVISSTAEVVSATDEAWFSMALLSSLMFFVISSVEDAEQLGEKGKVLEVLRRYKSEGVIKHIGFTGHSTAEGMKRAAELYNFDVMMMALNHQSPDRVEKFEELPAPFAKKKGMGVVAMKVIRPRETVEGLAAADLVQYALTLEDFHMINVGIDSMEVLKHNLEIIREFKPMDELKMKEMRLALHPFYKGGNLAWMQPSYVDGWNNKLLLA